MLSEGNVSAKQTTHQMLAEMITNEEQIIRLEQAIANRQEELQLDAEIAKAEATLNQLWIAERTRAAGESQESLFLKQQIGAAVRENQQLQKQIDEMERRLFRSTQKKN